MTVVNCSLRCRFSARRVALSFFILQVIAAERPSVGSEPLKRVGQIYHLLNDLPQSLVRQTSRHVAFFVPRRGQAVVEEFDGFEFRPRFGDAQRTDQTHA